MLTILKWGVIGSFLFCITFLVVMVLKTLSFGKKPVYAKPQGKGKKGIFYALGKGMMPWEKESARRHLLTYIGGILYHVGVLVAFFYLFSLVISFEVKRTLELFFIILIGFGLFSGVGLLLKRILLVPLRKISCADDFAANLVVELFLALGLLNGFYPGLKIYFYAISIILLLYIPAGKIRHCVFFFYTRILFGLFYGRRGVLPRKIKFET